MAEGDWHKNARERTEGEYRKQGYRVESSHGTKKVPLYRGDHSRRTFLSDSDIVLLKNGNIVKIVEIQSTCSPKQIVGIIKTTDLCKICRIAGENYNLRNVKLLVKYKKQKEKSKKPEQLQLIKDNLEVDGCLRDFDFEVIDE